MTPTLWRALLLSLLLSVAGVLVVALWLGEPGDLRALSRLSLPDLSVALLLLVTSLFAGGARLRILVSMVGERVNLWRATRAFVLGLFAAAVTPSGGGNAPAIGLSLIRDGVRSSAAWSVTIYSSIADLLFFAWSIPVASLVLYRTDGLLSFRLFWLSLLVSVASLVLWYLLAFELGRATRLSGKLFSLPGLRRWRKRVMRSLADVGTATAQVTDSHLGLHLLLQLLTALLHLLLYAIFYVIATSLGAQVALPVSLAILLLVSVTSYFVPTPGASGYLELAMSFAFARQLPSALLTATVVGYRALSYYAAILLGGLLGGAVLTKEIARRTQTGEAVPE
ncbi:MAG TPA: lysylphosphatidylglycerol synthase transmembrane domain-containing protein [Trueperaceae bacterium]